MKIKYFLMTAAIVVATSSMAMAMDQAAPMDGKGKEQTFEAKKAEILGHMKERMAEMQKKQACVEAAKDHEALKTCFPKWKEERGEHMKEHMEDHSEPGSMPLKQ